MMNQRQDYSISNTYDEAVYVRSARQGDLEAFNQLVLANQDAAFRQAYWMLGVAEDAEDIVQESFMRAYRRLSSLRGEAFSPWFLRIVTNACYDELRRRKRAWAESFSSIRPDGEEDDKLERIPSPDLPVEEIMEGNDTQAEIHHAIAKLPEEYATALVLVDLQDLAYAEAASVMAVPVGTVKSRLARGRVMLREALSRRDGFLFSSDLQEQMLAS